MQRLEQGVVLGERFRLIGELGQGSSASVWLAEDLFLHSRAALKIIHSHLATDPLAQHRVRREAAMASRIVDSNVVAPRALHQFNGLWILEMPVHTGLTLQQRISESGPLSGEVLATFARSLGQGVLATHQNGLVHRDICPRNILIKEGGSAALKDFGLVAEPNDVELVSGGVGTLGFMAPEAMEEGPAQQSSDLYSLGAVLYFAATGKAPYKGTSAIGVIRQQLSAPPPGLSGAEGELPTGYAALVAQLLQPHPAERPASASFVQEALDRGDVPIAPPSGESTPAAPEAQVVTSAPPVKPALLPVEPAPSTALQPVPKTVNTGRVTLPGGDYVIRVKGRTAPQRRRVRSSRHTRPLLPAGSDLRHRPPEEQLAMFVEECAGRSSGPIQVPKALYRPKFMLVKGVDSSTARRLSVRARALGFRATVERRSSSSLLPKAFGTLFFAGYSAFTFGAIIALWIDMFSSDGSAGALIFGLFMSGFLFIFWFVILVIRISMLNRRKQQQRLPLAFDLSSDRGQAASQAADAALPALSDNELVPPVAAVQNTPEPVLARPVKAAAKAEPKRAPEVAKSPPVHDGVVAGRKQIASFRRDLTPEAVPEVLRADLLVHLKRLESELDSLALVLEERRPEVSSIAALSAAKATAARFQTLSDAGFPEAYQRLQDAKEEVRRLEHVQLEVATHDERRRRADTRVWELVTSLKEARSTLFDRQESATVAEDTAESLLREVKAGIKAMEEVDAMKPSGV